MDADLGRGGAGPRRDPILRQGDHATIPSPRSEQVLSFVFGHVTPDFHVHSNGAEQLLVSACELLNTRHFRYLYI